MLQRFLDKLVNASSEHRSPLYKVVALIIGVLVFIGAVPALLFLAAQAAETRVLADLALRIKLAVGIACAAVGLAFALWTVLAMATSGKGTPVPLAPPRKLIVKGPYRLCRNPLQLGVIVYYFGIGLYFGSWAVGATMFVIGLILGSLYHKFIEEKELRLRFGDAYEEYRSKTPFLFPRLWS